MYSGIISQFQTVQNSLKGITGTEYNAILTFSQGNGTVIQDTLTGNYELSESVTVTLQAKLLQKKDPNYIVNSGVDSIRTYLKGWLVNPLTYDGVIPQKVSCNLRQNRVWTLGTLFIIDNIPTNQNEQSNIAQSVGQSICGYFDANPETT